MHEVQTDLSLTQHGYLGYAVVVNHRFWQSLSASDQQLLSQTMRDALTYDNTIADAQNDKALAALRASSATRIHTSSAQQREHLRSAGAPVHQKLASRIGAQWTAAMRSALAKQVQG